MNSEESKDNSRAYLNLFPPVGEYIFDPVHSFVEFAAQHMVVGQVWGRFNSVSGKINVADDPLQSTFEGSLDAASIDTHHPARDADLRSQRYFDVNKYPKMNFSSTGMKFEPGGHLTIDGNLTILGLTREVTWELDFRGVVKDQQGNTRTALLATTGFNRKVFGLLTDLEKETGGLPTGRDVRVRVLIEAVMMK